MSIRTVALAATAILIASPAFAATRHHKPDPILDHSGPISYAELQQIDSGSPGYNSRASKKHAQTHVAAASPDASAPVAADTTSAPSVANPADAVNAPATTSTTLAPPPTSTGQLNAGEAAGPTPIPSTPSSPTPPSTPQ